MVKETESVILDLSGADWASLSSPVKDFLKKQGVSEMNFQKSAEGSSDSPKISKRRLKLGERRHRPVAEPESEVNEEGDPAIGAGATARELSHHQANMEEGDPHAAEADPNAEEAETAEELEQRRLTEFVERFVGRERNPGTGRAFTAEEIALIYQKYSEANPDINDVLDMPLSDAHTELKHELESMIANETDPDRKKKLEEALESFDYYGDRVRLMDAKDVRALFEDLKDDLDGLTEGIEDPARKTRIEGLLSATSDFSLTRTDVLGDTEDIIEEELERETNPERKKQLKELLLGLQDRVAIDTIERFAENGAKRVASGYEPEFIEWMRKITEAQGARGTKEMLAKNQIGGGAVAYDTYAVLRYLAGDISENSEAGDEAEDAERDSVLESGKPDFDAVIAKMREHGNRHINWQKVEDFSPYGRELHLYIQAQDTLRVIEAADRKDRGIYDTKRRQRDEWVAVLNGEKQPTEEQLRQFRSFVRVEMGKAYSEDLEKIQAALVDARNLATYDHMREEGDTIERIMNANGENLTPADQAYFEKARDKWARDIAIGRIHDRAIEEAETDIRHAEDPATGYSDMGEDEGNPERYIARKRQEIAAAEARAKEIRAGAELTPEEMAAYQKAYDGYTIKDFTRTADVRFTQIKAALKKPPFAGLKRRVEAVKAKLPEGQTLDDLVARREAQQKYLLSVNERYRSGKGRTPEETAKIREYRDKVASPRKYYEHLQSIIDNKKTSHETNKDAHQRILDMLERDQGRFMETVFGEELAARASDRILESAIADINRQKPKSYEIGKAAQTAAETQVGAIWTVTEEGLREQEQDAHNASIDEEIAQWREKRKATVREQAPKDRKKAERYLYERYGSSLEILGVSTEDKPGDVEVIKRMASDLSDHIEHLHRRMGHMPHTGGTQEEMQNIYNIIEEQTTAQSALSRLEEMIKILEPEEAAVEQTEDSERLDEVVELSDKEQIEVDFMKDWVKGQNLEAPTSSQNDLLHQRIIEGLGYNLGIPGFNSMDKSAPPNAQPSEEQKARLEQLYKVVIGKAQARPKSGENLAEAA